MNRCGICGTPQEDDMFSFVTQEPVCSLCKVNYIGGLPTTPAMVNRARRLLGLKDGEYLQVDRGAEGRRILGR